MANNEMIERVAKALADAVALNYDNNSAIFQLYAKVSIETMRKPTGAMLLEATAGFGDLDKYQRMIDAALG